MKDKLLIKFVQYSIAIIFIYKLYILITLNFVMDEFVTIHAASMLHQGNIPFIDFIYGKPLLMHFLLQPIFYLTTDPVGIMWLARLVMLMLSVLLYISVYSLAKNKFNERVAWFSLLLLTLCSTEIERSLKIRTDNLTTLFFMASITLMLAGSRFWWKELFSGLLIGSLLFITQKSIYFIFAMAFIISWRLWINKDLTLQQLIVFIVGGLIPGTIYIGYTMLYSDINLFLEYNVFQALSHLNGNVFQYTLDNFYSVVLLRDPVFWGLSLFFLLYRLSKIKIADDKAPVYWAALIVVIGFIYHNVPWPYFFVTMIPLLSIVLAAEIDVIYMKMHSYLDLKKLFSFTSISPTTDYLKLKKIIFLASISIIFASGTISRFPKLIVPSNKIQIQNINLANNILEEGDSYFDGTWMLFDRNLAAPINLMSNEIKNLYDNPEKTQALIEKLVENECALIIKNYRIHKLSPPFQKFLRRHYFRVNHNVYTAGAYLEFETKGCKPFKLIASGNYRIFKSIESSKVSIDGKVTPTNVTIKSGEHKMCVDTDSIIVTPQYMEKNFKYPKTKSQERNLFTTYEY